MRKIKTGKSKPVVSRADQEIQNGTLERAFFFYPVNIEEKIRLAALLANSESLPKAVLEKYCLRTEFYTELFHSIVGKNWMKGYQTYSDNYKKDSLKRIESTLKETKKESTEQSFCWHLYAHACRKYLQLHQKKLQALLAETPWQTDSEPDSKLLIESVCREAFDKEVDASAIKELYELLWIERIENFEELLKLASEPDKLAIQAKHTAKLASGLDAQKEGLLGLRKDLDKTSKILAETQTALASAGKQSNVLEHSLDALSKKFVAIESKQASSENSLNSAIEQIKKAEDLAATAKKSVAAMDLKFAQLVPKRELEGLAKEQRANVETLTADISKLNDQLNNSVESLNEGIARLNEELNTFKASGFNTGSAKSYRSALSEPGIKARTQFGEIKELDFVKHWHQYLRNNTQKVLSIEELLACHCCFLTNRVIISHLDLFSSWIDCLGWGNYVLDLVVTPLWSNEADWQEGASYLFGVQKNTEPRILNLHNHDVGLVDCYLSPTLHLWMLKEKNYPAFNKLCLVPSTEDAKRHSEIMNYALDSTVIVGSGSGVGSLKLIDDFGRDFHKAISQKGAVAPASMLKWSKPDQADPILDQLESAVGKKLKISFNPWIKSLCGRTSNECKRFFDENSAVYIAVLGHLLPWLKAKYGEHEHDMVRQYAVESLGVEL
ncbi:MAG: hypothetical protein K2X93_29235 [Candidatus Obscuribacterales bacterium]|nr:hypothetical protein [Candidatus Obscuribacterales bacterium]